MLKPFVKPIAGSRRDYIIRRDRLDVLSPAEREAALAVQMALDMRDTINGRHDGLCTEDDLARAGWLRADIAALGEIARAHLLAGPQADAMRAKAALAA